jgi:hypothetical protein
LRALALVGPERRAGVDDVGGVCVLWGGARRGQEGGCVRADNDRELDATRTLRAEVDFCKAGTGRAENLTLVRAAYHISA